MLARFIAWPVFYWRKKNWFHALCACSASAWPTSICPPGGNWLCGEGWFEKQELPSDCLLARKLQNPLAVGVNHERGCNANDGKDNPGQADVMRLIKHFG